MEGLGERIRQTRLLRDMTQETLAARCAVKIPTVNQWEQEARQVKAGDLANICTTLDVSANYLLGLPEQHRIVETDITRLTGITPKAIKALSTDAETLTTSSDIENFLFGDRSPYSTITPHGLDAINHLLSCSQGLAVLDNIGVYLNAGEYRFTDGKAAQSIKSINTPNAAGIDERIISFTADVVSNIVLTAITDDLRSMKSHPGKETIDKALSELAKEQL